VPIQQTVLQQQTRGRGFYRLDDDIEAFVRTSGMVSGLCNAFIQHTSASLIINENADPAVQNDLERFISDLVIDGDSRFTHTAEGPDDMSAHVRSILTQTSLNIPVIDGRLALGTWQSIYLWEHRTSAHLRKILLTISA